MTAARLLAAAAMLAAWSSCGDDGRQQAASERSSQQDRGRATPTLDPALETGEELPSPTPEPKAAPVRLPTVRFDGSRCLPRTLEVGRQRTIRVRNRSSMRMRLEVPSFGVEVRVAPGDTTNLLFAGDGRVEYVCRWDEGSSKGELVHAPSGK